VRIDINIGICILVAMALDEIFRWSEHILENNVAAYLDEMRDPERRASYTLPKQGSDKTGLQNQRGGLFIGNGNRFPSRLREEGIIHDLIDPVFHDASTYSKFMDILEGTDNLDGCYIVNGDQRTMARAAKLNNGLDAMRKVRERIPLLIPPDFILYGASEFPLADVDTYIGTKTDLAIAVPVVYSVHGSAVEAVQVKLSRYGPTPVGQATYFGQEGLQQRTFIDRQESNGQLFEVYQHFANDGERVVLTGEERKDLGVRDPLWVPKAGYNASKVERAA